MPRTSPEHLEARRRQILDAARRCFTRDGFHATSMQHLFAEAGLSPGAVYRYFDGKDAIIAAIAAEALSEVSATFADRRDGDPPGLDGVLDLVLQTDRPPLSGSRESAALLVQIWAEALRSPALAEHLAQVRDGARDVLADLVERHRERGNLPSGAPAEQVADVLIALVDGYLVQRAVYGDADPGAFRAGIRTLLAGSAADG